MTPIPIKEIESIIRVRDELSAMERKVEHLRRELDGAAAEIISFLEKAGHLTRRQK